MSNNDRIRTTKELIAQELRDEYVKESTQWSASEVSIDDRGHAQFFVIRDKRAFRIAVIPIGNIIE